jgi:hypothetical protein
MSKNQDEKFIRRSAIIWLGRNGYGRNLREKETHEHGIDIKVRHNKYPRYFIVEVKGDSDIKKIKNPHSRREVYFIGVLGQIITRMKYKARYRYAIALPESYSDKVFRRLSPILMKKLDLSVLLVNKEGKTREINWRTLEIIQREKENTPKLY